jgi:hypothetical protein
MLDLRVPSGWFFVLMGAILSAVGLAANYTAPLTHSNVNLYTGVTMLVFGGILLWLARAAKS